MKLSAKAAKQTASQFGAMAVPEDHPIVPQLTSLYGEHTFFLDEGGLGVVEPERADSGRAQVVKLAEWSDAQHTRLTPHEPQRTNMTVDVAPETPNDAG